MTRMTPEDVQAFARDRIMAVAELAVFGEPKQLSLFIDPLDMKQAIGDALRNFGVFIAIGKPTSTAVEDRSSRGCPVDSLFVIYLAESPTVAHTPTEDALFAAVREAIRTQVDVYTPRASFKTDHSQLFEDGYVLRELLFTLRVALP